MAPGFAACSCGSAGTADDVRLTLQPAPLVDAWW